MIIMSVLKRQREGGENNVNVPSHIYAKRRRLVLATEKVTEDEILQLKKFEK